jgi:hypothetical protein
MDDFAKSKIAATNKELVEERAFVAEMLRRVATHDPRAIVFREPHRTDEAPEHPLGKQTLPSPS